MIIAEISYYRLVSFDTEQHINQAKRGTLHVSTGGQCFAKTTLAHICIACHQRGPLGGDVPRKGKDKSW